MTNEKDKSEMTRINLLISENHKQKWIDFKDENEETRTLSKLIRRAVDYYIQHKNEDREENKFASYSHNLKQELSAIKGFSQMLIEEYKDELSWEVLLKIKEIYDKSINIENIINTVLSSGEKRKQNYDILIVDDDDSTITLLSEFFRKKGFTIRYASLGKTAIDLLKISKPKLILLDILLPDINGYEICKFIKSDKELKDTPVFYITAVPDEEVEGKLKDTGAEGYFSKPFDMNNFNKLLEYLKE